MRRLSLIIISFALLIPISAKAASWSITELHYQRGSVDAPSFAGGASATTDILTLQGAGGHDAGDYFYFVDFLQDDTADGFNDQDVYGELYLSFMAEKIIGAPLSFGPVKDVGLLLGVNAGADANVRKWLPGLRFALSLPGFAFANLDITGYIDDSPGVAAGGAPSETDSYMIDFNGAYPFAIGDHRLSLSGHGEYIGARSDQFGGESAAWILLQPQIRYDLAPLLHIPSDRIFLGVEGLLWMNKLGDDATDETSALFLLVWRL